jgi:hypothetical protein
MGNLHRRLEEYGQQALLLEAPSKTARKLIEIASVVLSDDSDERVFTHPALCLTVLPHRSRPEREVWKRVNGPYTLMVQPTADHDGRFHGVPHGSKARLICSICRLRPLRLIPASSSWAQACAAGCAAWA